ncbi:MAG: polysaccharide biosynthesis tyrosine autokinase [Chloroflexi bacterium]|jgi:capsular exopolysaccharide synthesis family protein|nr:polysaccharide biosynthesis tyrosine autokinase [Chloroflexota bacterium]HOE35423.1 polysaccharide biosynthesis tyrosine autokinase [Anaerolineaceae bacterium]HOT25106.1 polysaccharide biosynthesis tyrosine autokinase [Anaerolineaceae bacterium]HQH58057.1 polysaccharide biosynthesis tyrosine autokinase [Anaerolineaceae bacterium]HQK03529.1 polysaccharide biosynthesis tyrosine autokinase [Anaerolineaceae bacterium]
MDIKQFFVSAKRWLWFLILGTLLGAVGGYFFSSRQTPIYQASTRFVVLRAAQTTYDYFSYLDSQQLISTYAQLLSTESLLAQASQELGFPVRKGQATAAQINDTQFVELTVKDTDPERAALIANGLVKVLIDQNEQLQAVRYISAEQNLQNRIDEAQQQISILQAQINEVSSATVESQLQSVQAQIDDLQAQVTALNAEVAKIDPETATDEQIALLADYQAQLDQLTPVLSLYQQIYTNLVVLKTPAQSDTTTTTQLTQLRTTLELYQQIYISSISSLETLRLTRAQNTPNVVQVEAAVTPSSPISPKPMQSALLAGGIGLLVTAAVAFLVEFLDDTIKTPDEVKDQLGLPVIGLIGELRKKNKDEKLGNYVAYHPRSPVSEAFRALRTNLEYSGIDAPLRVILVTSAGKSEGKTTVATNLAIVLAQSGKKVLLLDSDMRRPNVHAQFNIHNRVGLSDLVRGKLTLESVVRTLPEIKNLSIITSGGLPPNPAELLGSERMRSILEEMKSVFDVIVMDSPPMLVSDAQILSTRTDGVIYVIVPGNTHSVAAKRPLEELQRINANILGVVMNRIPRNRDYYYGGYNYYSPYSSHDGYHQTGALEEGFELGLADEKSTASPLKGK